MRKRIIVIGSGGAGLVAAIAARRPGVDVTVVSKTPKGLASCTAYAGGIFTLGCGRVQPEFHASKTMEIGCYMNDPELVQVFSEKAKTSLEEIISWGVTMRLTENGHASVRSTAPNPFMAGYGMVNELYRIALGMGVTFLENCVATSLEVHDGKVTGVECVNWTTGKTLGLGAGAVILATGGAGQVYERTDNPTRMTGDGYSLALRAGLSLRDMEFVQFYPLGWDEPGFTNWMLDLALIDHVPLTDLDGKEFLLDAIHSWGLKDGMEANYYARDRASIFLTRHINNRGQALLHLEALSEEEWEKEPFSEMRPFYPRDVKPWEYGPIKVSPLQHYMPGGIEIDTSCFTGIKGLYACGEVTGGVDGASRVGGNALTNIVIFGLIAGRSAGEQVDKSPEEFPPHVSSALMEAWGKGSLETGYIRKRIRSIVQEGLGPVRNAMTIIRTLEQLEEIDLTLEDLAVRNKQDLLLALEMKGLIDTSIAIGRSALLREESRGVHFREDFPIRRDEWRKNIRTCLKDGKIEARVS
ncbi:MAG: FAD-binding protein [Synergistales bacterium]|nr:FAD-binding protein [Synergistales bacterium]